MNDNLHSDARSDDLRANDARSNNARTDNDEQKREYRTRNHPTEDVNMVGENPRERGESEENRVIPGAQRNQSDPNVK